MLLKEVEVSITARCSLACAHCGFMVPNQPIPYVANAVVEMTTALNHLERLGFTVGSLAVVGGEATLEKHGLAAALSAAANAPNVQRVELVTNGLTPGGLALEALAHVDRLSLSDYTEDGLLAQAWQAWLGEVAPHIEFVRRRHDAWDRWDDMVDLGAAGGQAAYETCWYRRHCVTVERGRIFVCSRIPKLGLDGQGLLLDAGTSREQVVAYLQSPTAPAACRTCTPIAGLERVRPGQQPDDRLPRLRAVAMKWFARTEVEQ
jgi:hypothetical protein